MSKLWSTFGIEYSYLPDENIVTDSYHKDLEGLIGTLCNHYSDYLKDKLGKTYDIENDGECVELASPPFVTLAKGKKDYINMMKHINSLPLVSNREDGQWSGGGHIHVAIPISLLENSENLIAFILNLYRDVTNRPYLNWAFNEWVDDDSANNLLLEHEGNSDVVKILKNHNGYKESLERFIDNTNRIKGRAHKRDSIRNCSYRDTWFNDNDHSEPLTCLPHRQIARCLLSLFHTEKGDSIVIDPGRFGTKKKPPTIEFRFFDAKGSWQQVKDHVQFLDTYIKYIDKSKMIPPVTMTKSDVKNYKEDTAVKDFNKLIRTIGLCTKRYKRYADNIRERYDQEVPRT